MRAEYWVGFGLVVLLCLGLAILSLESSSESVDDVRASTTADGSAPSVPPAEEPLERYTEIVAPAGFVNTNNQPIKIADYVGKNLILVEVMTYSCSNCQRTFPYLTRWYEEYKDDGLVIIGIHTPEFAFEKDKANVEEAMEKYGITFPVVMDNDYETWRALGNRFWPRRYLIDWEGNVVFDHIGEGAYKENEALIKQYLNNRPSV